MKNIFTILSNMFSSKKETASVLLNGAPDVPSFGKVPCDYSPEIYDLRIIAGDATLVIADDTLIDGLGAVVYGHLPSSASEQECFEAMRSLISENFEKACETLIFKLGKNLYLLNIADCQNRFAYDQDGLFYLHLCEEEIDVFYPIIKDFIEKHSSGKYFGVTIFFGGGTNIGLRKLVNKLKEDGFMYYVVGTTLPFPKRKESLSEKVGMSVDNFEFFNCTPYIDESMALKKFLEEGKEVIFDAMKARVKEKLSSQ